MKVSKIEIRLTYFILTLAIFLLNFNFLSFLSIISGSFLAIFLILLAERFNIYKFKVVKVVWFFITFFVSIFVLNDITYFISDNILREYSNVLISLMLVISCFFIVNKGYHLLIKIIILASYFIFWFLILGLVLPSFYFDFANLNLNIFLKDNLVFESIYYALLMFYCYFLIYPLRSKFQIRDLLFNSSFHLITYLIILLVLGNTLTNLYEYPFIIVFKCISLLNFIERIEIFFSLNYLFCFYFFFLLNVYQLKFLFDIKNKKAKYLILLCLLLIFLFSFLLL